MILRLKQCERALADGRLDEAFDLVAQPDVRAHRRGQELAGEVVSGFIDRARRHLAQGSLRAAANDADKALQLGGNQPAAVQLRQAVGTAQWQHDRASQQAGQALALARRHLEQGQFSIGQQVLAGSPIDDPRLDDLRQELTARRAGLESSLKKATDAFQAGNWEAAIEHIVANGKDTAANASLRQLADKVADHVASLAMPHFESGRLDSAMSLVDRLKSLPVETIAVQQLRSAMDQCRSISAAITLENPNEVEESLRRLLVTWPNATWIAQLADRAKQWCEVRTAMRTSPLSLLARHQVTTRPDAPAPRPAPTPIPQVSSLILHVDGVGSFQVLTTPTVSIGPRATGRSLDLPLMIDPSAPTVTLSRSDEDYLLNANKSATVNDIPCTKRLLANGDRIGLGPRCRLTYRRPSAASGTAVIDLAGSRLPTSGIRQVILLDREIVIGAGSNVHIRADELATPVTLIRNGDGFTCRSSGDVVIDGRTINQSTNLPVGVPISVSSLRFVISRESKL